MSLPVRSAPWSPLTKMLVALVVFTVIGLLLYTFNYLIGPVITCFIITYLLGPVVTWVSQRTGWGWRASVGVVYLALALVIIGVLVAAGFAIQQQVVGLWNAMQNILADLPAFLQTTFDALQTTLNQPVEIGPFTFTPSVTFAAVDFTALAGQLTSGIQPALTQAGATVGNFAGSAITAIGWFLLILLLSFYLMLDLPRLLPTLEGLMVQGYAYDVRRMAQALGPIWNAYLRGQITLALIIAVMIGSALTLLGVRLGPVLGGVVFVGEFIPYVGPTVSAIIGSLVALFQGSNPFGLNQVTYALLVFATYVILQQIQGNVLYPRIMGENLGLHPVVILLGVFVTAQLFGFIGVVLSAPLLATAKLFLGYLYAKLFDLDPWPDPPPKPPPAPKNPNVIWRWLMMRLNALRPAKK